MLLLKNVSKSYPQGKEFLTVLHDISFEVKLGETVAIVGPSGSGKTTLLGLCAGLDRPTSGTLAINGSVMNDLNEDEMAVLRGQMIGFIFQHFQLLPTLTALENILVPMELQGMSLPKNEAMHLLQRVGLVERANHYPSQLSGGEQQRVALARAFANKPQILFADEPTGNLDEGTGEKVEDLIFSLNKENQTTLVLVTHDMQLARKTQRIIQLKGGHLVADVKAQNISTNGSTEL